MLIRQLGNGQKARARSRGQRVPIVGQGTDQYGRPYDVQSEGAANLTPPPGGGVMPPMVGACPYPEKLAGATATILTTETGTLELSTDGYFCPWNMSIRGSAATEDLFLTSIKIAMREQIISGRVNASLFGFDAECCIAMCLDCLCSPGQKLRMQVENANAMTQVVEAVWRGPYADVCPPGNAGILAPASMMPPSRADCVYGDKLIGVDFLAVAAGATVCQEITTDGRFCPRAIIMSGDDIGLFDVMSMRNGLESEMITSPIAAAYFALTNCCNRPTCFKCICAPGVRFTVCVRNNDEAPADLHMDMVGSYQDAC